jgi:hypothetical protein
MIVGLSIETTLSEKNKLHSSSENCETNLLNLINPSLAHVGLL